MLTHNEYDFINGLKMVLSKFKKKFHILILGSLCIRGNPETIRSLPIEFTYPSSVVVPIPARLLAPKLKDPVPEPEPIATKPNASGISKSAWAIDPIERYDKSSAINKDLTTTVSQFGTAVKFAPSTSIESTPHVTPEAADPQECSIMPSS